MCATFGRALGVSRWERLNRRERTRQLLAGGVVLSDGVPAAATPFSLRGEEESVHAFPARPSAHPYTSATRGGKNIIPDFEDPSRCHRRTSRPRYGGRPPTPVQWWWRRWRWRRRRSPLKGAFGEGGNGGGGGCSGGGVERSRARLTGTRGGGGGSAVGRRAGGTPPPLRWLGVARAVDTRNHPLIAAVSPSSLAHTLHTPDHQRLSPCFTLFSHIICIYFVFFYSLFPPQRYTDRLTITHSLYFITRMLCRRDIIYFCAVWCTSAIRGIYIYVYTACDVVLVLSI